MIGRGRVRRFPDPRGRAAAVAAGVVASGRSRLAGASCHSRVARETCPGCPPRVASPDWQAAAAADIAAIRCDRRSSPAPRLRLEAAGARDQIDQPAAGPGLVVEPHAGLRPGDDDGESCPCGPSAIPAPDLHAGACPEARPRSREPGRGARRRRPASRARSSRPPRNGHGRARRPEGRGGWAQGWRDGLGKAAGDRASRAAFPRFLPPLRRGPATSEPVRPRRAAGAAKGWTPPASALKSRQYWVASPAAASGAPAAAPERTRAVGSTHSRANQLNGYPLSRGRECGLRATCASRRAR